MDKEALKRIEAPIREAKDEIRDIVQRVLKLESEKLYQDKPRYVEDDIVKIIKEVVKS